MMRRIIGMSLLNFVTKIITALLVLWTQVIISRHYLMEELALYSKLVNYINIATVATGLGLNISAIYHLRKKLLPGPLVYRISALVFFALSALVAAILVIAGVPLIESLIIAAYSFLNNYFFLHNAGAQSHADFRKLNIQNLVYATVNLLAIAIIYLSDDLVPVYSVILLQCAWLFIINLVMTRKSVFRTDNGFRLTRVNERSFFGYGIAIFFTNLLGILLYSGDIFLLDIMLPDDSLAIYLLAATAIKFVWLAIDSMGLVLYPEFVQPSGDSPANKSLNKVFLYTSLLLLAGTVVFIFLGRWLIDQLYGPSFGGLYQLVLLLMIATIGVMFYKFLSRYFAALGNWKPIYISLAVGIATDVALILLLVPHYGIVGAAYASIAAYFATGATMAVSYFSGNKKYKTLISQT